MAVRVIGFEPTDIQSAGFDQRACALERRSAAEPARRARPAGSSHPTLSARIDADREARYSMAVG
jgi:hypothetical protein